MHSSRRHRAPARERTAEIFGVNPVLEALRAGRRPFHDITIASGVKDSRLQELIDLARRQGVPVHQAPRGTLDKMARDGTHQGVVARVAAAQYSDDGRLDRSRSGACQREPGIARIDPRRH